MEKQHVDKSLFVLGVGFSVYFLFLFLNYHLFHLDFVLLGVVQELITISLMMAVVVVFAISLYRLIRHFSFQGYLIWAAIILLACSAAVWGSLVFS